MSTEILSFLLTIGITTLHNCREDDDVFFRMNVTLIHDATSLKHCQELVILFQITDAELREMFEKHSNDSRSFEKNIKFFLVAMPTTHNTKRQRIS